MNYSQAAKMPNSMFTELKPIQGNANQGKTESIPMPGTAEAAKEAASGADHTKISSLVGEGLPGSGSGPTITSNPTMGSSVNLGAMLEGKLTVELFDALIPSLLVTVLYYFKLKLRKTELQMTAAEKNVVAPILQQCLNSINLNFTNPWHALAAVMAFIYGSKVIEKAGIVLIDEKNEKKAKKAENPLQAIKETPATAENVIAQLEKNTSPFTKWVPENKEIQKLMRRTKKTWKECKEILLKEGPGYLDQIEATM